MKINKQLEELYPDVYHEYNIISEARQQADADPFFKQGVGYRSMFQHQKPFRPSMKLTLAQDTACTSFS